MLLELNIENFAIIKDIKVNFSKGLNIITGETGTGKSILIEALGIILGARSNKDFIRTGETEANLQAVFYIDHESPIEEILSKYQISIDSDRLLIINKQISQDMPSLSKVNGKNVNLSMLSDITSNLIDIFGQHEHQSLLNVNRHKELLDSFGGKELKSLKNDLLKSFKIYQKLNKKLTNLSIDELSRDREIDILEYQIQEIESADIDLNKDVTINEDYKKLKNINNIREALVVLSNKLKSDSFQENDILNSLDRSILEINNIKDFDSEIEDIYNRLNSIKYELEDIYRGVLDYLGDLNFDDTTMLLIEKRLDTINSLKSKYGESLDEVLDFKDRAELRLESLQNQDREIMEIEKQISEVETELKEKSFKVSNYRKKLAKLLENEISLELKYLNMEEVEFKVDFKKLDYFSHDGIDYIEFLISTNIGEKLKPLSKIASGGEMSRIMLAFKNILAEYDNIQTLIFDEIDTGISGRTAQLVGEKIYHISRKRQVICISHLPQITALADSHYSINKLVENSKTGSYIKKLTYDERVEELARLIGGIDLTNTTKSHAKEMLYLSDKFKKEL